MLKISFTNAEVSDHGYGLEVNGKSLEDIISTALGTKVKGNGGYGSGLPSFRSNSCDVTVTINPHDKECDIETEDSTTKGALIYNSYTALRPSKKILSDEDPTSKKTLPDTSKNFLLNKDSKDNIEKSISKEMEGKAPKKRSYSTILEDPVNKFVKEALSKFIQYCRGKNYTPKVTTVEKFASTLRDNAGEDPVVALAIVDQSIDKGWKDLYPLKNYGRQGKPTAVSKKFSGNTLKDAEGKDIVF